MKEQSLFIEASIIDDFFESNDQNSLIYKNHKNKKQDCNYSILKNKNQHTLELRNKKQTLVSLPYHRENFLFIYNHLKDKIKSSEDSLSKMIEKAEKSLRYKSLVDQSFNSLLFKIKTRNLQELVRNLLKEKQFHKFESSFIFFHLKGKKNAKLLGVTWKDQSYDENLNVTHFNLFFNSVKKSKIKAFNAASFSFLKLPFNGSFLAKEIQFKTCKTTIILSRNDFLYFNSYEIKRFESCVTLLTPFIENLINSEFIQNKNKVLESAFTLYPLPLQMMDRHGFYDISNKRASLLNDFSETKTLKKVYLPFSKELTLYDCEELRISSFDLFHFQRIHLLGELLNTLKHELSNPLLGLNLACRLLKEESLQDDDKDLLKNIEQNITHCQNIIDNFANLYSSDDSQSTCDIKVAIQEALTLSKSELQGIEVKKIYEKKTGEFLILSKNIVVVQILFNLIINASHSLREQQNLKNKIHIYTQESDEYYEVYVSDNGAGVDEKLQEKIFTPFFTTKHQGTGLGLSLSKSLAKKIGGDLRLTESSIFPQGATFVASFPKTPS